MSGVSPVVCSKLTEVPKVPVRPCSPDMNLPGISPLFMKEKRRKKKAPEILVSDRGAASLVVALERRAGPGLSSGSVRGRQHLQGAGDGL